MEFKDKFEFKIKDVIATAVKEDENHWLVSTVHCALCYTKSELEREFNRGNFIMMNEKKNIIKDTLPKEFVIGVRYSKITFKCVVEGDWFIIEEIQKAPEPQPNGADAEGNKIFFDVEKDVKIGQRVLTSYGVGMIMPGTSKSGLIIVYANRLFDYCKEILAVYESPSDNGHMLTFDVKGPLIWKAVDFKKESALKEEEIKKTKNDLDVVKKDIDVQIEKIKFYNKNLRLLQNKKDRIEAKLSTLTK